MGKKQGLMKHAEFDQSRLKLREIMKFGGEYSSGGAAMRA